MMKKIGSILSVLLVVAMTLSIPLTSSLAQQSIPFKNLSVQSSHVTTTHVSHLLHDLIPSFPRFPINNDLNDRPFTPSDASLQDDVFHNSNDLQYTEWWYFDAKLSDNYTVQFSIHVFNILTMSFISVNYNVYQFGKPLVAYKTMYPASDFYLSSEEPYILLKDDNLRMVGFLKSDLQTMYYHISYMIENSSMDLYYGGITKGWKGTTSAGDWAVILPKARVTGSLTINNTKITVNGIGYHDHNWNVTISAGLNFGWIWGKTNTEAYTITWADILTTWFIGNPLLIINKEYDGYYSVPVENLSFAVTDVAFKNGMLIPYGFSLKAETSNVTVNMTLSVVDTDYTTIFGIVNYWRYHVHSLGTITFDDHTEHIDEQNIAEFIRFRFY